MVLAFKVVVLGVGVAVGEHKILGHDVRGAQLHGDGHGAWWDERGRRLGYAHRIAVRGVEGGWL